MKLFDEVLAAEGFPAQWKLLLSIPAKDHPKLLKAIQEQRTILDENRYFDPDNYESEENKKRERAHDAGHELLDAATFVALQHKAALPKKFNIYSYTPLRDQDVWDFLCKTTPAWLPSLFKNLTRDLALQYLRAGVFPPFPDDHRYHEDLPQFITVVAEGKMDRAMQFLLENPDIVSRDFHPTIRRGSSFEITHPRSFFDIDSSGDSVLIHLEDDFSVLKAVHKLSKEGHFDLIPLVRTTLETLLDVRHDFPAVPATKVHLQLEPSPSECLELQELYFSVLSSPNKSIVKFVVSVIDGFCALDGFDAKAFTTHVGPVFLHNSNPLHLDALKLCGKVLKHHPAIAAEISGSISQALLNPNPKVQTAVLKVFEALPASATSSAAEELEPFSSRILASLLPCFGKWMAPPSSKPVGGDEQAFESLAVDPGATVTPVESAAAIAFVASKMLIREIDPMHFELFFDGVARFAGADSKGVSKALTPLQTRALKILPGRDGSGFAYPGMMVEAAQLIILFGPNPEQAGDLEKIFGPFPDVSSWPLRKRKDTEYGGNFEDCRIRELLESVRQGRQAALMATPQYDLGFIDDTTLAKRFREIAEAGLAPMHFDFIQAIARYRPHDPDQAMLCLPERESEASRVLQFLFTGKVGGPIETPPWWLAAARIREPLGDFSKHPDFSAFHRDEPDWTKPASYQGLLGLNGTSTEVDWESYPANHFFPTFGGGRGDANIIRRRYTLSPGFLDSTVGDDMEISSYIFMNGWKVPTKSDKAAAAAIMSELGRRRLPLRHTMQVHLLVVLNGPGTAEREAAVEILIQADLDGRMKQAITGMGHVFAQLFHGEEYLTVTGSELKEFKPRKRGLLDEVPKQGHLNISRLLPALQRLSIESPALKIHLRDILTIGLMKPPVELPKGIAGLLELFLDLLLANPPEQACDLSSSWGDLPTGKVKTLVARISKTARP